MPKLCISKQESRGIIMADFLNNKQNQEGNTPLAQGKDTITDIFSKNKNSS